MKTLTKMILSVALTCFLTIANAQTPKIDYAYDAAGNRVSRTIVLSSPRLSNPNSTDDTAKVADAPNLPNKKPLIDAFKECKIKIYPNPTKGNLYIEIENLQESASCAIKVYDLSGRFVFGSDNIKNSETIDLSGQSNGTYIMKIFVGVGSREWKIIKE